jgi:hypothetical protein
MTGHLSDDFVREAFHAAGEKRYALARLAYPHLLGPHWRWAIVGWAYIKCLDDLVDENASGQRAIETLHAHKETLERVYAGSPIDPGGSGHASYGQRFCAWDRSCGSPLRASMKEVLELMEFDLQRRGEVLPREEIDQYLLRIGRVMIDFLFRFAAPGLMLSEAFCKAASRAYLYADTLIDLAHDIDFGLINIPAEDLELYPIRREAGFDALRPWIAARAPDVERHFDDAIDLLRELPLLIRFWGRFFLTHKRKAFRRFLKDGHIG